MLIPVLSPIRLPLWVLALSVLSGSGVSAPLVAQAPPPDSTEVHREARRAQRDFENLHRKRLPLTPGRPLGRCDEYIGRLCLSEGDSDWEPVPDDSVVMAARSDLIQNLSRAGTIHPGDHWILGQEVRYLGSTGAWGRAEEAIRRCRHPDPWWCPALEGYVLHRGGKVEDALIAFEKALGLMDQEAAEEWRDPTSLVDYPLEDWLRRPPSLTPDEALTRFWILSDPLFLTPGNEGLSEHYARRFAPYLFDGTEITMGMPWGRAFEELLIRYGFIAGWERVPTGSRISPPWSVILHHHPESRGLVPPFEALQDPAGLPEGSWTPRDGHPKNAIAPVQAPLVAQGLGQVATFRREGDLFVVVAYGVPEDTVFVRRRSGPGLDGLESAAAGSGPGAVQPGDGVPLAGSFGRPPWEPPAEGLTPDTLAGLFLLPDTGGWAPVAVFGKGGEGILTLQAPPGAYLLSLEQWNPAGRWGARIRQGLRAEAVPTGVPHASDLLLLQASPDVPPDLASAIPHMLRSHRMPSGTGLTVAWELYGLGRRGEPLGFDLALAEEEPGFLRRTLARIGLFKKNPALKLTWEEEGSRDSGPRFRAIRIDLPELDSGRYELRLQVTLPNRTPLVLRRAITVT